MGIVAIRRHLLEAIEFAVPLVDGALIVDVDVALEAIAAGMVLPDNNEGQFEADDLDKQYAFGAVTAGTPVVGHFKTWVTLTLRCCLPAQASSRDLLGR